ncbi:MAG: hypothetical protein WCD18_20995 [Thermosynechococcaceae cyanobacterium]
MTEPIFWLGCSFLLVAVSLTAVLVSAIPAMQELARAARSAEKLFDTLYRELPPTLESIRLTGLEISDLTDDISDGVESAGQVVKQVDQGLRTAQRQVQDVGITASSIVAGVKAAWKSLLRPSAKRRRRTHSPTARYRHSPANTSRHRSSEPPAVPYEREWPSEQADHSPSEASGPTVHPPDEPVQPNLAPTETFPENPLSPP